jgi:hypothetical protein
MAPGTIHLHIGAPKTGTTYLQHMLAANREALKDDGVLLPRSFGARAAAVRTLLRWRPESGEELPESWQMMADEMRRWRGRAAVLSQEFLCRLDDLHVRAAVASLGSGSPGRVRCVLTVRDISRLVTAQWQTALRSHQSWTLDEYCAAVASDSPAGPGAAMHNHFWVRHGYRAILDRWIAEVGIDNVTVVTVPSASGDPEELWRRFCSACDLEATTAAAVEPTHESLGATSAEFMRRFNKHPVVDRMRGPEYQQAVSTAVARRGLAERRNAEPKLSLPPQYGQWAQHMADQMIADITATGVAVVGDLDDLQPRPTATPAVVPEDQPSGALLDAAVDALAGLALEHVKLSREESGVADPSDESTSRPPRRSRTVSRAKAALRRAPLR